MVGSPIDVKDNMDAGEGEPDAQTPATRNNSGRVSGQLPSTIVPFAAIHDGATVRAKNSTSFPVYSSTGRSLAATNPADAPPPSSKRRLFGQTLPSSLQANSAATANMSSRSSGSSNPATPRKSSSPRLAGSTATSMDTDTSKKRSPTTKKTPRAKTRQAASRGKSATGSSPASSSMKRKRTRRKPAPKPITPPKKKIRVVKYVYAPKNPRANTALPEQHDGSFGAVFNPYGLEQAKFLLPEFSSLGHSTLNTSSVSVLQQAFGNRAASSASGRRNSTPLFTEREKPMVIKKSGKAKANGGAKIIKIASVTKARAASASPKTTKKARDATSPAANGSAGPSTNKAIRKETGGSKNTYMEDFARSKASAATQDTAANGYKKRKRPSVSTESGSASAPRASSSARDDSSHELKTSVSTTPPRKQRAAIAPMTSAATIKAYFATPAKKSATRPRSRSRSRSASAVSSMAKTTKDDDGEEEEPPKKKLKKKIDTRTTKAKRKASSTSNLPRNNFMYSSTPTQSDGDTPQSKRVSKNGAGRRDAHSASPTAGKGKGKAGDAASSTTRIANYDGGGGDGDEELREALFSSSPPTLG